MSNRIFLPLLAASAVMTASPAVAQPLAKQAGEAYRICAEQGLKALGLKSYTSPAGLTENQREIDSINTFAARLENTPDGIFISELNFRKSHQGVNLNAETEHLFSEATPGAQKPYSFPGAKAIINAARTQCAAKPNQYESQQCVKAIVEKDIPKVLKPWDPVTRLTITASTDTSHHDEYPVRTPAEPPYKLKYAPLWEKGPPSPIEIQWKIASMDIPFTDLITPPSTLVSGMRFPAYVVSGLDTLADCAALAQPYFSATRDDKFGKELSDIGLLLKNIGRVFPERRAEPQ